MDALLSSITIRCGPNGPRGVVGCSRPVDCREPLIPNISGTPGSAALASCGGLGGERSGQAWDRHTTSLDNALVAEQLGNDGSFFI
jgi:hypothetical protein